MARYAYTQLFDVDFTDVFESVNSDRKVIIDRLEDDIQQSDDYQDYQMPFSPGRVSDNGEWLDVKEICRTDEINVIQYLSMVSGHRDVTDDSDVDDEDILYAWITAKRDGVIPDDDPIPYKYMITVAEDYDLLDDEDELSKSKYNQVLVLLDTKYGVDPGRDRL